MVIGEFHRFLGLKEWGQEPGHEDTREKKKKKGTPGIKYIL